MRVGRSDISRFYLLCNEYNNGKRVQIEDIEDFDTIFADIHTKEDNGYFSTTKEGQIKLGKKAYEYLLAINVLYGVRPDVRLITEVKDERKPTENWTQISNVAIDLKTLQFNDAHKTVSVETIKGGFLETIEARWEDEFNITAEGLDELPYVNLRLEPRKILKRTKFIPSNTEVSFRDDQGSTARAIPLDIEFTSQQTFVGAVSNVLANSVNDTYAGIVLGGCTIISNAPQDFLYVLNGTISIQVTYPAFSGNISMDLVRYNNGQEQDFDEIILNLDNGDPSNLGETLTYTFTDYQLSVKEGDSIMIGTLSNVTSFSEAPKYKLTEDSKLTIYTDTPFIETYTKALLPRDAFKRLIDVSTDTSDINFESSIFDEGGEYETVLLLHGSWIRNMPQIVNKGEDDERRIQQNLSLKKLYEGYKILKPLMYEAKTINGKKIFYVGLEKETQRNFIGVRLGETRNGEFKYIPLTNPTREVIGDNYYGSISIGSTTSGSNYGEVNNLYSICGVGNWNTFNKDSKEKYEVTTEIRTGSEDIELERQFQWVDYPDLDTDRQNDWFFAHAVKVGDEYHLIKWQSIYAEQPKNVYDADSNYNWIFSPRRLLEGHGWKIKSCLDENINHYLRHISGENYNDSLITKKNGEQERPENGNVYHTELDKATVRLMSNDFKMTVKKEIIDQLNGKTNGIDNRYGLIEHLQDGELVHSRLIDANSNKDGEFKLIEAIR